MNTLSDPLGSGAWEPDPGPTPSEPRHLARVEDLLCRELDGYRDLLDVMLKEKEMLTANRPETLPDILEEQRRTLEQIRSLELARGEALSALAGELDVSGGVTLRAISGRLEGPARERVDNLREALGNLVPRVDQVNRINVLLIRNSMSYISETVRAILDEASPRAATYAAGGRMTNTEPAAGWTDRRI